MLSFSSFSKKYRDAGIGVGIGNAPLQSQLASRKSPRSLKRWLSMRKISQEYGSPRKHRYSNPGIPPHKSKNIGVYGNNECSKIGTNITAYEPIKPVDPLSLHLPLMQTGCGDTNWPNNDEILLSLLQHGFDMPAPSPTPANAPPPSADDEELFCSNAVTFTDKTYSLRRENRNSGTQGDSVAVKKSPKPKSQPPRRKRSLIYAMYCTAQADGSSVQTSTPNKPRELEVSACDKYEESSASEQFLHGVPLHDSVPSLATTENLSTAFFSCQSMSSLANNTDIDTANTAENALGITKVESIHGQVNIDKDVMDIGDLCALEDEEMFMGSTCFEESCLAGLAEIDNKVPSITSSRSSLAEELPIVESSAYRCSNRYAPRLSTIERAHDGRLRIRPSSIYIQHNGVEKPFPINDPTTEIPMTIGDTNRSNEPATEDDPHQNGSYAEPESAQLPSDAPSSFNKLVCINGANNTVTPTASSSVHTGSQASVCDSPVSDTVELCPVPLQPKGSRPMSAIVTPPESPEKASTVTANASLSSYVFGSSVHTESDSKPRLVSRPSARKKHYSSDDCDLVQHRIGQFSSMRQRTEPPFATTRRSYSYDGWPLPVKQVQMRINPPPAVFQAVEAPRLSEWQHPSMRLPTLVNPQPERKSLLFDGDYGFEDTSDNVSRSIASTVSPTHRCGSGHIGVAVNRYAEEEGYSDADDIDGDTPLADVLEFSQATIVAPPVLVEVNRTAAKKVEHAVDKENKYMQSSLVVTDKTRWYSSALAKAAHLDGFRHLHLKIKVNANQKSRSKKQTPVNKSDSRKSRRRGRSSSNERSPVPTAAAVSAVANATITSPGTQDKLVRQRRKKTFRFNEAVAVYETWDRDAYDRKGMPLTRLDTEQLEIIKEELNTFKMHEMYVHEDSRANTHIIC